MGGAQPEFGPVKGATPLSWGSPHPTPPHPTPGCAPLSLSVSSPQLFGWTEDQAVGGMEGAMKAMLAADPNFGTCGPFWACWRVSGRHVSSSDVIAV